ncbi:MAG TPA: hypothetical protein VMC41_03245, partial [Candidatus Nanoarchaeia archaeon]|nr:hypothetical protein [Candidatus Nanoarchaeia archaeon]
KFIFLFGLSTLFIIPVADNPPMYAVIWLVLIAYIVYHLFFISKSKVQTIFFILKSIGIFILFNVWWLLSFLYSLRGAELSTAANSGIWMDYTSANSSFLNIFRLLGEWAWSGSAFGTPYISYPNLYTYPLFIAATFVFPVLVFLSLFLIKKRKNLFFFFFLIIFALFLAKGSHAPLPEVNKWLFLNVPYFWLFREPWPKFTLIIALSFSVVSCLPISEFLNYLQKQKNKIGLIGYSTFILFILAAIIIAAYPIFSGDIIRGNPTLGFLPGQRVSMPSYWFDASSQIDRQKEDYRILFSPMNPGLYVHYDWGYQGVDPAIRLLPSSLVVAGNGSYIILKKTQEFINQIYKNILQEPPGDLIKLASLFNIGAILQRNDFDWTNFGSLDNGSPGYIKDKLAEEGIDIEKTFDKLDYYKIDNKYILPHLYTPQNVIISSQSLDALPEIVSQPDYNVRSAIYFNDQNIISDSLFADRSILFNPTSPVTETISKAPVIEFKKIDPTKYRVIIHNAKENFPLVFSESFHSGWKAYLVKDNLDSCLRGNDTSAELANYKILDGNADDQATADEVKGFIDQGYVSTLGDLKERNIKHDKWENYREILDYNEKYKIDFISHNFQGTIQNDNLPNGNFWDTWLEKPLPEQDHIMANDYANSWIVEPDKICADNKNVCVKNPDGSYDFEMVVEFWPQRLFYIGLFISSVAFLFCLGYFGYGWARKKEKRKI